MIDFKNDLLANFKLPQDIDADENQQITINGDVITFWDEISNSVKYTNIGAVKAAPKIIDTSLILDFGTSKNITITIPHNANHLYPTIQFYGQNSEELYIFGITERALNEFKIWSLVQIDEPIIYIIG